MYQLIRLACTCGGDVMGQAANVKEWDGGKCSSPGASLSTVFLSASETLEG
jgi:hypothetical protein